MHFVSLCCVACKFFGLFGKMTLPLKYTSQHLPKLNLFYDSYIKRTGSLGDVFFLSHPLTLQLQIRRPKSSTEARKESYSSFTNLNLNRNNVNKILNHLHFRPVQDNVSKHGQHSLLVTQVWRTVVYSPLFSRRLLLLILVRFLYRPKIMVMNFFGDIAVSSKELCGLFAKATHC
jgi:hypothetical protein